MGDCPLITPEECLREAWHADDVAVSAAAALRRSARTITFLKSVIAELAQEGE